MFAFFPSLRGISKINEEEITKPLESDGNEKFVISAIYTITQSLFFNRLKSEVDVDENNARRQYGRIDVTKLKIVAKIFRYNMN